MMDTTNIPRVRPSDLEDQIASEHYFTAAEGCMGASEGAWAAGYSEMGVLNLLTFCVLVLKNGFTVTGESAVVSPELFDAKVGRDVARQAAINKLWPLMGFRLKDRLCAEAHAAESPDPEPGSGPW